MFQLQRFASLMSRRPQHINFFIAQNQFVLNQIKYNRSNVCVDQSCRYFSKKPDDCKIIKPAECKPKEKKECKPSEKDLKKCDKKPLPYLQECTKPNLMSECPKPQCAQEPQKSDSKNLLLLALLALAATLGALYYFLTPEETKAEKKTTKQAKNPAKVVKQKREFIKDPVSSRDIPKEVPYLLIGGGTAAFAAFRAIKSNDPTAKVLVISNEDQFPYMRPPLSKELWFSEDPESVNTLNFTQWNGTSRSLFYEPKDFYMKTIDVIASETGGVAVARGWSVSKIDVINKKAILSDGTEIFYEKCLIATGSLPKSLDVFEGASDDVLDKTALFRTINDFQCLQEKLAKAKSVAIIGGGFLGSELACALAQKKKKNEDFRVIQVFKEGGHMGGVLPEYLSFWTTDKIKSQGVEVMPFTEVMAVTANEKTVSMTLSDGKTITTDLVIVAVGSEPNTDLAETSDLEVDPDLGGFLVNTELQARSNLYVAGDAACFYDPQLGRRRIEHHDNAVISGRLAGENMTGASKPYVHQSMFWSDLGPDIGYEAIGIVHSSLPTVGVFAKVTKDEASVGDLPKVTEVPDQCIQYLSKEEEEKVKEAKALLDRKKMEAAERKTQLANLPSDDFNKGVIFYLRDDIIVGIVLWNVFNRMSIARQVLKEQRKYEDLNEVAKLFNIHEE